MAGRKKFLPEDEIQRLERMAGQQYTDHLSGLSREELEKLFTLMLNSVRLYRRVSNAAVRWFLSQTPENWEEFVRCAAEYMPDQISMHGGDVEVLCDELTFILEQAGILSHEELVELLEGRLIEYEQQLQKMRAVAGDQLSLPARTPVTR
jgi:hypothetical protein